VNRFALLVLLVGCGPAARDEVWPDGAAPPDVIPLPDGIWEPDPGLGRTNAHLVADGSDIWFVYSRTSEMPWRTEAWLTKTTSTGEVVVPPMRIDGAENGAWPMAIARSGDNVAALWKHGAGTLSPRLRLFDGNGQPLSAEGNLVPVSTVQETYMTNLALVGRADGSMRMFATYDLPNMTSELGVVELDATGTPVGQAALFGTADGSVPTGLAAVEVEGNTLVAWDRRYDYCQGYFDPDALLYATVGGSGGVGTETDINPSGRDDREPALAALGSTAYVAWTSETDVGTAIRVSRATNPGLGFVDAGIAPLGNRSPMLALADPTHGAVAWFTDEPALRVASLSDIGTTLAVGATHIIPLPTWSANLRGIVHVGDQRYVVSWTEESLSPSTAHLYALVVDLALAPRPVPAGWMPSPPMGRGQKRCSH